MEFCRSSGFGGPSPYPRYGAFDARCCHAFHVAPRALGTREILQLVSTQYLLVGRRSAVIRFSIGLGLGLEVEFVGRK